MSGILKREDMLVYLITFGKYAPEYYLKLNDEKLKQEYDEVTMVTEG